jgi:hypothetical protein
MTTFLIIAAILAVAYIFAAITFYYGFKNWYPLCGGKSSTCRRGEACSAPPADRFPG